MAAIIAGVAFLVVLIVVSSLWALVGAETSQEVAMRRLEAVRRAEARGTESASLKLIRDELLSEVPALHKLLSRWEWVRDLQLLIDQSGLKVKPGHLLTLSFISAFGVGLIVYGFLENTLIAVVMATIAFTGPLNFVLFRRRRRLRAFERHFPEALDLLGRAVRAGHAFTTGLEMIGKELPEPVAGEFRMAFEEQNLGLPIRDAFLNLSQRVPSLDVRFFITALMVQKETGGNLGEILDNLSRVIRERFRIYGEVRTRSAQGRLTAIVLIALPLVMMLLLSWINPDYIGILYHDPWGHWALLGAFLAQLIGTLIIWRIVSIKV